MTEQKPSNTATFRDCPKCRFRFVAINENPKCRTCGNMDTVPADADREVAVRKIKKINGEYTTVIIYRKAPLS